VLLRTLLVSLSGLALSFAAVAKTNDFPGGSKYPDVAVIEKQELLKKIDQVVIVDARSSLEFDTLRIKGAVNIPVASKTFEDQVRALRAKTDKPIVFYCNGRTCMKSYLAVRKAKAVKVDNLIAYDAGMFEWAKTYPNHAELLGKSPVSTADIISKTSFKQRLLDPTTFENQAHKLGQKSLILDVRDKYQRGAAGFFPAQEIWASLDDQKKLNEVITAAKKQNKTLFIYDEVGKQVRWLQYALEQANVKDYYFMAKGAKGYYQNMMQGFSLSTDRLQ
jgi:rhodanese-related sulfurtransferase